MASDVYLQMDGIKGESTDDKHKDWIELIGVDWGVQQPTSGTASTSGGHTIGRAEFEPITCAKMVDLASPKLMEMAAQGKTIPKATLEFVRADGSGPIIYFSLELENVLVGKSKKTYPGSGLLQETFELRYTKLSEKYVQQKIGGGTAGNATASWNLATNKAT